jgi:hypothetical protein
MGQTNETTQRGNMPTGIRHRLNHRIRSHCDIAVAFTMTYDIDAFRQLIFAVMDQAAYEYSAHIECLPCAVDYDVDDAKLTLRECGSDEAAGQAAVRRIQKSRSHRRRVIRDWRTRNKERTRIRRGLVSTIRVSYN